MDKRFKSGKHVTFSLGYCIVWCSKYSKPVITESIESRLKELLLEKAKEEEWKIITIEIMPNFVRLLIEVKPSDAPITVASRLKGYTSSKLRSEFPKLKSSLPTLWTRNFFVVSIGYLSEPAVRKYLISQKSI